MSSFFGSGIMPTSKPKADKIDNYDMFQRVMVFLISFKSVF